MSFWTLEYSGTELSLADWGFDEETAEQTTQNMSMDVFTLAMPGAAVDSDPVFPFEAAVIIRSGRAFVGGVWSGGLIEFQGKRLMAVLDGRPDYEGIVYQFGGPWYDIDQTAYQQTVYYWTGGTSTASYLVSDVVLFQKVTGPGTAVFRNTGEQITDILQHVLDQYSAQSMAAPFQIGVIDPAVTIPTYQVKDIKCSEAIAMCMRTSPDAVVYFEYAYSPPKIHVLKQSSMHSATVAIGDGVANESLRLTPRPDLQARGVVLYFKQNNLLNGDTWVQTTKQKYPLTCPEGGLRVLVQTIDLAGWAINQISASLTCTAVANTQAWWQKYIPEFANSKISGFSVGTPSVVDESGSAISLSTYPNVLDDGASIASWMRLSGGVGAAVVGVRAKITAQASYTQKDASGREVHKFEDRELTARVVLTNGITDNYTTVASTVSGEDIPATMAQDVYNALATLQYEGDVSIVQQEISNAPGVGNVLNLTGGRTEWTTMNALIQTVRKQYGRGRTEVTIGPARHLSAADLTQLFLINRFRWVRVNPISQATAKLATAGSVALGGNAPKENTQAGLAEKSLLTVASGASSTTTRIQNDAVNSIIKMRVEDAGGSVVTGTSSVHISLGDLEPDAVARGAKFQWLRFKDANNACAPMKCLVLMTDPEVDT